jgi:peptide/nickel transport system permease protein
MVVAPEKFTHSPGSPQSDPSRRSTSSRAFEVARTVATRPAGIVGGFLTLAVVSAGFLAPLIAPHSPYFQFPSGLRRDGLPLGSSSRFLLGTDALGRDEFSRLLFGIRNTLEVALGANVVAAVVGVAVGCPAGYFGRWLDAILMRFTEVLLAIPAILLAAFLALVTRPSQLSLILIIGSVSWFYLARIVRAEVLSIRRREFVEAAFIFGSPHRRIMFGHVLRQVWSLVVVYMTLEFSTTATFVAAMSFVGVGIQPPTPDLGNMIAEGSQYLTSVPRLAIVPGIALGVIVLGFNLLGDSLHDALANRD